MNKKEVLSMHLDVLKDNEFPTEVKSQKVEFRFDGMTCSITVNWDIFHSKMDNHRKIEFEFEGITCSITADWNSQKFSKASRFVMGHRHAMQAHTAKASIQPPIGPFIELMKDCKSRSSMDQER